MAHPIDFKSKNDKVMSEISEPDPKCGCCGKINPGFLVRTFPVPSRSDIEIGLVFCKSCQAILGTVIIPIHKSPLAL